MWLVDAISGSNPSKSWTRNPELRSSSTPICFELRGLGLPNRLPVFGRVVVRLDKPNEFTRPIAFPRSFL